MRNLSLSVLVLTVATGGFLGCGGGATRKPTQTGAGGNGGNGGTTGTAGTGAAGTTGVAGTTGTAGTTGVAGTTGIAGTTGAAGDGTAGTAPPPPPPTCDNMTKKTLPYAIQADFKNVVVLHGANTLTAWKVLSNPDCDTTVFPPLNPPADGGVDGGADAGVDGGNADVPVSQGGDAAADAPRVDGSATDVAEAGSTGGTCVGMTYNPDPCVAAAAANGGNAGDCWDGVIFAPTAQVGNTAPGICIEAGAKKIEFWARASSTARIKWGGAFAGPGDGVTEFFLPVTTTWAKYTIDSPANVDYNTSSELAGVWNGFSVVGEPGPHAGGTYIFVKDIKWTK